MIPIIGTSMTKFGDLWDMSLRSLIKEAGSKSLLDANISVNDIDAVYIANCFSSGAAASEQLCSIVCEEIGVKNCFAIKGDISGAVAIQAAARSIKSKSANAVLVIGAEKITDLKSDEVTKITKELIDEEEAMNGSTLFANWAMISSLYSSKANVNSAEMNIIPVINHKNGKENPFAQFRSEITSEKIESSPYICEPLRLMGCASFCDGACAVVMCSEDFARNHKAVIKGKFMSGSCSYEPLAISKRKSLTHFNCAKESFENAVSEAKISKDDVKIIEVHDICAAAQILSIESMGFAKTNGIDFIKSHEHMINKSGGLKACGHAVGATGVRQAIDAILRLGKNEIGIAQTLSGCASGCAVNVFGGSNA